MRTETFDRIKAEVRDKLHVPSLVGDNCPFTTLSTFLSSFHTKTETGMNDIRNQVSQTLQRSNTILNQQNTLNEQIKQFKESVIKDIEDL